MKYILLLLCVVSSPYLFAHCQIPCGIFNDELRIHLMFEHITTLEKSMKMIKELSSKEEKDFNQLVRWIQNKESHAQELEHIVTFYFLQQRIKLADEKDEKEYALYLKKVVTLHQILVYSMRAKQTTDLANIEKLRTLVKEFRGLYFGIQGKEEKHAHAHEHGHSH